MKKYKVAAFDLGNGYIKRTYDGKEVLVDPSVYAVINKAQFNISKPEAVVRMGDFDAVIGNEAARHSKPRYILGLDDGKRYGELYQQLLINQLIKDSGENVEVGTLVLGLPVDHYYPDTVETLKGLFQNINLSNVMLNGNGLNVKIKEVVVLPQPWGTFFKYIRTIKDDDNILIVDMGFGTIDYLQVRNNSAENQWSTNGGIKKTYDSIKDILKRKYPGSELSIMDIEQAIKDGKIKYQGELQDLPKETIEGVMELSFNSITDEIINKYNTLSNFDRVFFTGGTAEQFKKQIIDYKSQYKNIHLVDEPQQANVIGFYYWGSQ